jgi:hypothetical protein
MPETDGRPGTIVLLNGASSSGKSSIVRALQTVRDEPALDAGLDRFLWMLPKRYLEPPLWDQVLGRAVEAGAPGHRLVRGMHRAIAALSRAGCPVVADHVLVEPAWVADCAAVVADPLLDAAYHLTAGSPARDAGTPVDLKVDVDGHHRPVGAFDIGADEYALHVMLPLTLRHAP